EPEIGGKIDEAGACLEQLPGLPHGHAVRCGEEYDIAAGERLGRRLGEGEPDAPAQARKHVRDRSAGLFSGSDDPQLDLWMLGEQPQQLDSRVARATDD